MANAFQAGAGDNGRDPSAGSSLVLLSGFAAAEKLTSNEVVNMGNTIGISGRSERWEFFQPGTEQKDPAPRRGTNSSMLRGPGAERFRRKALELEIETAELARVLSEGLDSYPGSAFSLRLCTLLACDAEASLADTIGVPVAIILAGKRRMYDLAAELVARGKV